MYKFSQLKIMKIYIYLFIYLYLVQNCRENLYVDIGFMLSETPELVSDNNVQSENEALLQFCFVNLHPDPYLVSSSEVLSSTLLLYL